MAERRMFAKSVVESEAFLDLPISSRLLYYDLGMSADDDGFVDSPNRITRITGASENDLKLLIAMQFLIQFDSGIVVIRHWKINNYIQKDRYVETTCKEEMCSVSLDKDGTYTLGDGRKIAVNKEYSEPKPSKAKQKRAKAKRESSLPHNFEYKIRSAFLGEACPVCGIGMERNEFSNKHIPSIQHNTPISKGGKHEISNISVICRSCNVSIRDVLQPAFNTDKVKEIWQRILKAG